MPIYLAYLSKNIVEINEQYRPLWVPWQRYLRPPVPSYPICISNIKVQTRHLFLTEGHAKMRACNIIMLMACGDGSLSKVRTGNAILLVTFDGGTRSKVRTGKFIMLDDPTTRIRHMCHWLISGLFVTQIWKDKRYTNYIVVDALHGTTVLSSQTWFSPYVYIYV